MALLKGEFYCEIKFVLEAYEDATKESFGYLCIDPRPETDENYQIRSNNFPDDERQYALTSGRYKSGCCFLDNNYSSYKVDIVHSDITRRRQSETIRII